MHVIDSGGLYGAERVLLSLIEVLKAKGVDCELASISEPGLPEKPLEHAARLKDIKVCRVQMRPGPDKQGARELVEEAGSGRIDVLHTHGYKANYLISGMPRRERGIPALATLHGWTATRLFSRMRLYETAERHALRHADCVVAVSEAMVEKWRLRSRYGDRLCVIPNGIPMPIPSQMDASVAVQLRSFFAGRAAIFAAGRLSYEKGFDILLDALAIIREGGTDACLVLAGHGPMKAQLSDKVSRMGLADALLMPGYLDCAGAYMPLFDVVAIPSRSEGLPIILLEALMQGVPVAATSVGGMPWALEACAIPRCAAPDSPEELATLINDLLMNRAGEAERLQSAQSASAKFSSESMASAYLDIYERQVA